MSKSELKRRAIQGAPAVSADVEAIAVWLENNAWQKGGEAAAMLRLLSKDAEIGRLAREKLAADIRPVEQSLYCVIRRDEIAEIDAALAAKDQG